MTREEAKNKVQIKKVETYPYGIIDNVDEVIDQIFDEFGEQLQDKDYEIELFKQLLEEAMKPKTCLGCLHCNKAYQLTSFPPQYELNCGVFKTVFVNDFKQYCSRYDPKEIE